MFEISHGHLDPGARSFHASPLLLLIVPSLPPTTTLQHVLAKLHSKKEGGHRAEEGGTRYVYDGDGTTKRPGGDLSTVSVSVRCLPLLLKLELDVKG